MDNHVLVPVDGSRPARSALEYALEQFPDARLTLLYVVDPMIDYSRRQSFPGYTADDEHGTERQKGEAVLESLRETVPDDRTVETALEVGRPARVIVGYADDRGFDGIVLGSHGRAGSARYLLGSVAEQVVRRAGVPVTVVRGSNTE
ncbi:universal stress protein [Natronorubrum texcoconense]|uniref:Nucleotide-binding universal stress protein, UspA family n=1 Tax=Natronorubrum texcoconense TaxID=1095776 RepID=A0A1G9BTM6_9EURY|nr:universal stress protein [Natronorubrum texcoconense]SDK42776.1 Nucleotide-binding universal stress protein, UspA family [Natronorubrum texcoconense]